MAVPNIFGSATAAIPLSQLDTNFATAITLGNTAVYLGNTTTSLGNVTLTNVTISSGNVSVTGANVSGTANISTLVVVGNATVGGNATITGNITAAQGAVFNESGADSDFRVESNDTTHMLFVDAGTNRVSVGGASGTHVFNVLNSGTGSPTGAMFINAALNGSGEGLFIDASTRTMDDNTVNIFRIANRAGADVVNVNVAGEVTINEGSSDADFRVESDGSTHMLFVDGGENWVSIGGNTQGAAGADLTVDGGNGEISCYNANGGIYFGTGGGGFGTNSAIARASTAGFHISSSNVGDLCIGAETNTLIRFGTSTSGTPSTRMTIAANGDVNVVGALSKGSGSFRIDHPLPSKKDTHQLVHSFVEAPQADLIYRGKAQLVSGRVVVNLDQAAGMTEGTFVVLCRDVQCFTSNEQDWDAVRGSVSGNILTIECQNPTSAAVVSWMVIGERQDPHMYETDWTDENGKVIVEPLKKQLA